MQLGVAFRCHTNRGGVALFRGCRSVVRALPPGC